MTHSNDNRKSFMKGYGVLFKKKTMIQKEQKFIERWHHPSPNIQGWPCQSKWITCPNIKDWHNSPCFVSPSVSLLQGFGQKKHGGHPRDWSAHRTNWLITGLPYNNHQCTWLHMCSLLQLRGKKSRWTTPLAPKSIARSSRSFVSH